MIRTGFKRKGALQMTTSVLVTFLLILIPLILAGNKPTHEWLLTLTGLPVFIAEFSAFLIFALYLSGFLQFCADKGYSKWLGFLLMLAALPGFLVLLFLPDLKNPAWDIASDKRHRHAH